ncbi:hypothetical protein HIM_11493 [Hirsutella minnesotensis 3608]|uniref:Uncharacterized protein n=1 Tax=Hirsutella minnesotensis 3608 TaxID=1043627 RepID=A0A0F8A138_9HYPO|nr:hypothetical protein HIM_11493 [Hirsutella minnesotensis 3608]
MLTHNLLSVALCASLATAVPLTADADSSSMKCPHGQNTIMNNGVKFCCDGPGFISNYNGKVKTPPNCQKLEGSAPESGPADGSQSSGSFTSTTNSGGGNGSFSSSVSGNGGFAFTMGKVFASDASTCPSGQNSAVANGDAYCCEGSANIQSNNGQVSVPPNCHKVSSSTSTPTSQTHAPTGALATAPAKSGSAKSGSATAAANGASASVPAVDKDKKSGASRAIVGAPALLAGLAGLFLFI